MADTVSITLGANTTGAINAIRNFTSAINPAITGVQKLASGLSNLGSNAASVANLLGKTATGDAIAKWTDLGTSIAFSARALVDVGKGAAQVLQKLGPRTGPVGILAAIAAKMGYEKFQEVQANQQREEALKNLEEYNRKLKVIIEEAIELKRRAGAITGDAAAEFSDQTAKAFGQSDPQTAMTDLARLHNQITQSAGNREVAKAKLAENDYQLSIARSEEAQFKALERRIELIREAQRTFEGQKVGFGKTDIITEPTASSTAQEVADYRELVGLMKEREETQAKIDVLVNQENQFLTELAETSVRAVQTALAGVADAITGLIMGTRTWAQAFQQSASSILSMVIQLVLRFTVLYGLVSALQFLFPGSGFVAKFAGFAGFPGKAFGGLVGSGVYQVGERGPEYVINNATLARMGSGFFDALQSGYTPRVAQVPQLGSAAGASAGGSGSSLGVSLAVLGGPGAVGAWAQTREGRAYVVDIVDQRIRDARS